MRLCLLVISEATPIKSHQPDFPNMKRIRMTPKDTPKWTGEILQGLNPTLSTIDNSGNLGMQEEFLPRKEYTNLLPSAKWTALKRYIHT